MLLSRILILNKRLNFLRIHMLHHLISSPLLNAKTHTFMTIILIIRLILMILHLDELAIHRPRIKTQAHQHTDRRRLRNQPKRPALLGLEPDEIAVVLHDLVFLIDGGVEEFRQSKPLPSHLVAVVDVDELVLVA
jgi:hypothetical protein